jgi:tight adherence protein C
MLIGIIGVLVFLAVASMVVGLARRSPSAMEVRMQDFRTRTATVVEGETDLTVPFADRVLLPGVEALANLATSVLPAKVLANIEKQLMRAGSPMTLNAYVMFWIISVSFMSGLVLFSVVVVWGTIGPPQAVAALLFGAIGWQVPVTWLKGRVRRRQNQVQKALPDALDLVTTCVEAGLGLDAALARVAQKSSGPLSEEISSTLRDVSMGKLRRDALADMADRLDVDELTTFVNAVVQAEQLGVGISQVLKVQSEQMRMRRRQRAEKTAHEAPIKMIFPLVLFIFPAFMLVILGPAIIRIASSLGGTT